MAEMFNPQNPEILELNRQRKMAELLTNQGFQTPQGQTVAGGIYVPVNPLEQIASLYSVYAGKKKGEALDLKEQELAQKLRELGATEVQDILGAAQGTPEKVTELAGPAYKGVSPTAVMPAVEGNTQAALAKALMGQSPQAQALVPSLIQSALPKKTNEIINYEAAKQSGFKGSFDEWRNQLTPFQKEELGIKRQELGLSAARYQLDKAMKEAELSGLKLNEQQGQAVGFGTRAKEASEILKNLENKGVKDVGVTRTAIASTLGMTPLIGDKLEQNTMTALNATASKDQQATLQARKNFATAVLRKESGASISPTEFADVDRIYFPQPGDSSELLKQKQRARDLAIQSLEVQAGPGARFIREFKPQTDFGGKGKVVNFNDLP